MEQHSFLHVEIRKHNFNRSSLFYNSDIFKKILNGQDKGEKKKERKKKNICW